MTGSRSAWLGLNGEESRMMTEQPRRRLVRSEKKQFVIAFEECYPPKDPVGWCMGLDPIIDILDEYIEGAVGPRTAVRFAFPVDSNNSVWFIEAVSTLARIAKASGVPYEVITNTKGDLNSEMIGNAAQVHEVRDVATQLETTLIDAHKATLMVIWDTEEAESNRKEGSRKLRKEDDDGDGLDLIGVLRLLNTPGVPVYDLTGGCLLLDMNGANV
jgi:hypothetical protein